MIHFFVQFAGKNKANFLMVLFFVLISNFSAFSQTAIKENNEIANNTLEINTVKSDDLSNMNFVLWFMGSKQDPNVKISPANENTRRQFITSGLAPNRLLIKAFLKKAVNFEVATS